LHIGVGLKLVNQQAVGFFASVNTMKRLDDIPFNFSWSVSAAPLFGKKGNLGQHWPLMHPLPFSK
jgi:hypothetical protein